MQVIYLEVRKIYQPGYSGGRGERQKIYLVLECELSSVAGILCVTVRPERTPQENLFGGRSGRMAEDQAAGMPPSAGNTILALGAGEAGPEPAAAPGMAILLQVIVAERYMSKLVK